MSTMSTISLVEFVLRHTDGSIDHEATLSRFAEAVLAFESEQLSKAETIGAALEELFNTYPKGTKLPKDFVTLSVATKLGYTKDTLGLLQKSAEDYIRASSRYAINRGKGGGVGRVD